MKGFSVIHRNFGHWDIIQNNKRIYRIRGGPSNYLVLPEDIKSSEKQIFNTVPACMAYICDNLMYELIVVEG